MIDGIAEYYCKITPLAKLKVHFSNNVILGEEWASCCELSRVYTSIDRP